MAEPLRIAHYLNQFFGGIGGEDQADAGVTAAEGPIGPGKALQQLLGGAATIAGTIVCGDNTFNERTDEALAEIEAHLKRIDPDVVVAGPAFNAGRYGLACARVCMAAQALGIPAVTAMHPENPGAVSHRAHVLAVPTSESAASMNEALAGVARLALKLGRGEALGSAEEEGYLPRGLRKVHDRGRPGYARALDMLLAKLHGEPFVTEVPIHAPERVPPAAPLGDLTQATIALVTTGGLVRKGNPDRQVSFNPTRYYRHSVTELKSLGEEGWEAYHAGYFNHIVNTNPNYILPLNFMRELEHRGAVGQVYEWIYALPGVSTPVATAIEMGLSIAEDLRQGGVDGVLLVAT